MEMLGDRRSGRGSLARRLAGLRRRLLLRSQSCLAVGSPCGRYGQAPCARSSQRTRSLRVTSVSGGRGRAPGGNPLAGPGTGWPLRLVHPPYRDGGPAVRRGACPRRPARLSSREIAENPERGRGPSMPQSGGSAIARCSCAGREHVDHQKRPPYHLGPCRPETAEAFLARRPRRRISAHPVR